MPLRSGVGRPLRCFLALAGAAAAGAGDAILSLSIALRIGVGTEVRAAAAMAFFADLAADLGAAGACTAAWGESAVRRASIILRIGVGTFLAFLVAAWSMWLGKAEKGLVTSSTFEFAPSAANSSVRLSTVLAPPVMETSLRSAYLAAYSQRNWRSPMVMVSMWRSVAQPDTGLLLTSAGLVLDLLVSETRPFSSMSSSAWKRDTTGSATRMSQSLCRPMEAVSWSGKPPPSLPLRRITTTVPKHSAGVEEMSVIVAGGRGECENHVARLARNESRMERISSRERVEDRSPSLNRVLSNLLRRTSRRHSCFSQEQKGNGPNNGLKNFPVSE